MVFDRLGSPARKSLPREIELRKENAYEERESITNDREGHLLLGLVLGSARSVGSFWIGGRDVSCREVAPTKSV